MAHRVNDATLKPENYTTPGDATLSRRAVLIERDEKHCESAAKRLEAAVPPELVPVTAPEPFDFGSIA